MFNLFHVHSTLIPSHKIPLHSIGFHLSCLTRQWQSCRKLRWYFFYPRSWFFWSVLGSQTMSKKLRSQGPSCWCVKQFNIQWKHCFSRCTDLFIFAVCEGLLLRRIYLIFAKYKCVSNYTFICNECESELWFLAFSDILRLGSPS